MPESMERKAKSLPKAWPVGGQKKRSGFPIVGMGASAGGLEALQEFFKAMSAGSGMAFVVVAHLDPTHVSLLPELLQKCTSMPVRPIADGTPAEPDHVYVIPPNKDLRILDGVLRLFEPRQPRGTNLPIDTFFRSLAEDQAPTRSASSSPAPAPTAPSASRRRGARAFPRYRPLDRHGNDRWKSPTTIW